MNIEETIFFICLIVIIVITITKIYNVLKVSTFYDHITAIILFISMILVWGIGLICSIVDYNNTLLMQIQKVSNFLLGINLMLGLVEMLLYTSGAALNFINNGNVFRKRATPTKR